MEPQYFPEGSSHTEPDVKDLHQKLLSLFKENQQRSHEWKEECRLDRKFYAGEQWDEAELQTFQQEGRLPIVVNEIKPTLDLIGGMESRNRLETKVLPRTKSDIHKAQIRTLLIKYVGDQNDMEYRIADAFADTREYGFGVLSTGIADKPGREAIFVKREDPDNFFFDQTGREADLEDAEFAGVEKMINLKDLQVAFPDYAEQLASEVDNHIGDTEAKATHRKLAGDQYKDFYNWTKSPENRKQYLQKQLKAVQMYYRVREEGYAAIDRFGDSHIIEESDIPRYLDMPDVRLVQRVVSRVYMAIYTARTLLYNKPSPYKHQQLPYVIFWADRNASGAPSGPIRQLRDLQREVNRRRSAMLQELTANQWILQGSGAMDLDKLRLQLADPNALIDLPPGMELRQVNHNALANQHMQVMMQAIEGIRSLSGANDALRGQGGQYQSGTAINLKQQQGTTIIAKLFDNLRRARKQLGYQLLSLIHQSMTPDKIQRICELEQFDYTPEEETRSDMLFDIVIEEQQLMATDRQSQLFSLNQIIQQLPPEIRIPLLPEHLTMYDLPMIESLVAKIQTLPIFQQMSGLPPPGAVPPGGPPGPGAPEGPGGTGVPPGVPPGAPPGPPPEAQMTPPRPPANDDTIPESVRQQLPPQMRDLPVDQLMTIFGKIQTQAPQGPPPQTRQ